jgi:RNA polymerase sigma factor (sigma-70 family)
MSRMTYEPVATAALGSLVDGAAIGDERAWRELVSRFGGLVGAVARAHRLHEADAADVTQVTWMRLVEHADRLHDPERVGPWLATTARRECLRVLRENARAATLEEDLTERVDDAPSHGAPLIRRERDAALRTALAALCPRDRRLLRMLVADPRPSYREIGDALGMPVGSIGPTRTRALHRLRHHAQRLGVSASALEDSD